MSVWNRSLWLAMIGAFWPGLVHGQVLFTETFNDGAASGRWFVRQEGDNGVQDISVQLNFDYSTLGIAPAPHGTGSIGAKLDSNVTGAGGAETANIFPIGQSFGGDFVLRVDVWSRVAGDPTNSAEDFLAGVNASGTRTNWLSSGGTGTDGLFHGATGNGWNAGGFDYVRYIGNTTGDPHITPLYNNTDALPQATFPTSSGTPQNQWVTVDIEQIAGVMGFRLNGVTFDQFVNGTSFTSGNIFLGHQDVIATTLGNPNTFTIFDNVTVRRVSRWLADANASWNVPGDWSVFTLNNPGVMAYFGNVITAPRTITLPTGQIMGDLTLDSPVSYTFSGPGPITLAATAGNANLDVRRGSHSISATVEFAAKTRINVAQAADTLSLLSDPIVQPGVSLTKAGAGTLQMTRARFSSLAVLGGTVRIIAQQLNNDPDATSIVKDLWIAGPNDARTARLDLTNNSLIIDYDTVAPLSVVRQWLRVGLLGGNGMLTSSLTSGMRLGFLDNVSSTFTNFAGQPVDSSSLLIGYTFAGDANLDGKVDVLDLVRLANHWLGGGFWMDGDFNYDGIVNVTDLGLMAVNWQAGVLSNVILPGGTTGSESIPEPTGIATLAGLLLCIGRRQARRKFPESSPRPRRIQRPIIPLTMPSIIRVIPFATPRR